jgi:hypothetical protein
MVLQFDVSYTKESHSCGNKSLSTESSMRLSSIGISMGWKRAEQWKHCRLHFSVYCNIASTRQDEQQRSVNLAATFLFNVRVKMSVVTGETFA